MLCMFNDTVYSNTSLDSIGCLFYWPHIISLVSVKKLRHLRVISRCKLKIKLFEEGCNLRNSSSCLVVIEKFIYFFLNQFFRILKDVSPLVASGVHEYVLFRESMLNWKS